eukprot:NODE_183_length_13752_cov_1.079103.p8 type:complete len:153 gc:universal NODE_183_length_13752_cov_1.079103:8724-8266(-)
MSFPVPVNVRASGETVKNSFTKMDLISILDDPSILNNGCNKSALNEDDFEYFERVFDQNYGNVNSKLISEIALLRNADREPVRMWFMNRKMREHKSLLKRYKRAREIVDKSMFDESQLRTKKSFAYYTKLLKNTIVLTQVSASYQRGRYNKN